MFKGYQIRYLYVPKIIKYNKTVSNKNGNYLALISNSQNNQSKKITLLKWLQTKPVYSLELTQRITNCLISDDGNFLIIWQQDFKNKQYIIKVINIFKKEKSVTFTVQSGLGYSQLWPLDVSYCDSKILIRSYNGKEILFFSYTKTGHKTQINAKDYYKTTTKYFYKNSKLYAVKNDKFKVILNYKDFLKSNQHGSKYAISKSKEYICVNIGLSIYILNFKNKKKILLKKRCFDDYFYWNH